MRKVILLLSLCSVFFSFSQSEYKVGLNIVVPLQDNFENLNKTAFNFQFKYLGSITDDFYLGLSTGADVNFTDVEVYDGAINFIPVLASARHYFFEYVYVNVDGGYGFEISQIFQSGIRLQGAVGYSFDGFDLQLGYVSQQSGDFNFSGGSIGAYLHI